MRKLCTLVLLAFLAAPSLSFASAGPADIYPKNNVVWVALGTTPMAVEAAPAVDLVTICYYGVTMMVSEKIAKRYLRIGARCGSCEEARSNSEENLLLTANNFKIEASGVCDKPCDDWNSPENLLGAIPCGSYLQNSGILPPASTEKIVQIGK